jgi:glycosyltransferase involved in cell wall biosynthesis
LDLVDCPSRYVNGLKAAPDIPLKERLINALNCQILKWEGRALHEADTLIVNLPQDIEYLRGQHGNATNISVVPNCVPSHLLPYTWAPPSSALPRLLFVANLAYPPHRIALEQFALSVFPKIRHSLPTAELWVTGKGQDLVSKRVLDLEGIHFTGFVPDLLDVYSSANMLVSPQSVITGLQYKTLEALAIGVPIIASRTVIATSGLTQGQDCLAADSAGEYVTAAERLWEDHKLATDISAAGKMFIRGRHTWEVATVEIERILQMR